MQLGDDNVLYSVILFLRDVPFIDLNKDSSYGEVGALQSTEVSFNFITVYLADAFPLPLTYTPFPLPLPLPPSYPLSPVHT